MAACGASVGVKGRIVGGLAGSSGEAGEDGEPVTLLSQRGGRTSLDLALMEQKSSLLENAP